MKNISNIEILLVEDNMEDADLVMRSLKKNHLSNSILHVIDGAEALDFIFGKGKYAGRNVDDRPKVVLLDLKMPKVGGIEVLRAVKSDDRTKAIPVVVMTSSREDRDLIESYELGVNAYVVKPVSFEIFSKTMADLGMFWVKVNEVPK